MHSFDVEQIKAYWKHLHVKVFTNAFDATYTETINKLELRIMQLYLVNCIKCNKKEKCHEFFEKYTKVKNFLWFVIFVIFY